MSLRSAVYAGMLCQDLVRARQLTSRGKLPFWNDPFLSLKGSQPKKNRLLNLLIFKELQPTPRAAENSVSLFAPQIIPHTNHLPIEKWAQWNCWRQSKVEASRHDSHCSAPVEDGVSKISS